MNDAYPLPSFRIHRAETLCEIVRTYPLATLISGEAGSARISLIPLLIEGSADAPVLLGHLDNNNAQSALLTPGAPISFQFQGPNSYASPDLYPDAHLPGWLYVSVQGDGRIHNILNNDELRDLLIESTRRFGTDDQGFSLSPADGRFGRFINLIKGFRIEVERISGIAKFAQDKGETHARIATNFLAARNNLSSQDLFTRILQETL